MALRSAKATLPGRDGGTWHGRFVVRGERGPSTAGERPKVTERPNAQERPKAPERAPKPARDADEIPSLDELADMLDG